MKKEGSQPAPLFLPLEEGLEQSPLEGWNVEVGREARA